MSRVGRKIIPVPKGVNITVGKDAVAVKGPKGELKRGVPAGVTVALNGAEVTVTRAQIEAFEKSLDTFRLDVGRYPTSQEGLAALRQRPFGADRWDGPYIKKDVPADPWGRPYYYRSPGEGGRPYDLLSYGGDGAPGGDGDNRDITSYDGDSG